MAGSAAPDIRILDFAPFLEPGIGEEEKTRRCEELARQLRSACEEVGFHFITGVDALVPEELVDEMFQTAVNFHDLDMAQKTALLVNRQGTMGYTPNMGNAEKPERSNSGENLAVKLMTSASSYNEAFFMSRGHGNELAQNPFPDQALPEMRHTVGRYDEAMHNLTEQMLPVYARALGMPVEELKPKFKDPLFNYRLTHYPPTPPSPSGQLYGVNPHADVDFLTILAQNKVPGLSLQLPSGDWMSVPALPKTFLVNTGEMLHRLSNGRFRNTVHKVMCGSERYAVVCFVNADRLAPMEPITLPGTAAKWPSFTAVDIFRERMGLPKKEPVANAAKL